MFVKIAVFFLLIALIATIVMIFRQRRNLNGSIREENPIKPRRQTLADSLADLTLPQLQQKLRELERTKEELGLGFLQMNKSQQRIAIARRKKIKTKIILVKEVIGSRSV